MGYRAHLVTKRVVEYKGSLYEDNYDKLSEFFERLGVQYYDTENQEYLEVDTEDLLALKDKLDSLELNEQERDDLSDLIRIAQTAQYARDDGFVRIEWF